MELLELHGRLLLGACDPLSTPRPLGPLFDIAEEIDGSLKRLIEAAPGRDELFTGFLDELVSRGTTLVVIEDVHWADEATLDLLFRNSSPRLQWTLQE